MTDYQLVPTGTQYAIDIWTDDLRLIARTGPTDEATARADLDALRRGMPLSRLVVRDHPQGEWRLAEQAPEQIEVAA